jgi:thiamine-phosphate pyrophosphorylase
MERDVLFQVLSLLVSLWEKHSKLQTIHSCRVQGDGLHIGKSDYDRFEKIRNEFRGVIGVSCYGNVELAQSFEQKGADYVAFGAFFHSPTKPSAKIVTLDTLQSAKNRLDIPVCAIGGINTGNIAQVKLQRPDMISCISAIFDGDIQQNIESLLKA